MKIGVGAAYEARREDPILQEAKVTQAFGNDPREQYLYENQVSKEQYKPIDQKINEAFGQK